MPLSLCLSLLFSFFSPQPRISLPTHTRKAQLRRPYKDLTAVTKSLLREQVERDNLKDEYYKIIFAVLNCRKIMVRFWCFNLGTKWVCICKFVPSR